MANPFEDQSAEMSAEMRAEMRAVNADRRAEAAEKRANMHETASHMPEVTAAFDNFNAWMSAHNSNVSFEWPRIAFNVAQPKYMIMGFMITVVLIGLILLGGLISSTWYDMYGAWWHRLLIFLIPLVMFVGSWVLQGWSNSRKDGTFDKAMNLEYMRRKTETFNTS